MYENCVALILSIESLKIGFLIDFEECVAPGSEQMVFWPSDQDASVEIRPDHCSVYVSLHGEDAVFRNIAIFVHERPECVERHVIA